MQSEDSSPIVLFRTTVKTTAAYITYQVLLVLS